MTINSAYIYSRLAVEARFGNRKEYNRYYDVMAYLVPKIEYDYNDGGVRVCKNFHYSRFDGALYGYDGIERFSSSYNNSIDEFFSDMGVGASYHTLSEYGLTPPIAGLFNVGYFLLYSLR